MQVNLAIIERLGLLGVNNTKEEDVVVVSWIPGARKKNVPPKLTLLIFLVELNCFLQPVDLFYTAEVWECETGCFIIRTGPNALDYFLKKNEKLL